MNNKTSVFLWIIITLTIVCLPACSDDGSSSEKVSEITGLWTATSATFNGEDVVEAGGNVTLDIKKNGRFTFTIKRLEKADMVFTGKLGFDEQWLEVEYDTDPGEYEYYDITYDDHNLHIGANSEFDFDGDGTAEIVVFFLEMEK